MIIKCPECGHQVSDKAPVCPNCGVEIAGHVVKCSHCGEIYLKEDEVCPNCHQSPEDEHNSPRAAISEPEVYNEAPEEVPAAEPATQETPVAMGTPVEEQEIIQPVQPVEAQPESIPTDTPRGNNPKEEKEKKNKHIALLVTLAITVITLFVFLYFYRDVKINNERNEFESAMQSRNPDVLQQYIAEYEQSAPMNHIQEAKNLLTTLQEKADDWAAVVKKNSREAYIAYRKANPNSPHEQEIENRLDEMDWTAAQKANNEDAYAYYIDQHPQGKHHKEAGKLAQQLMTASEKKAEEEAGKQAEPVRKLLQAMNAKNSEGIKGAVAETLNFNGAAGATAKDVAQYMRDKLYQADVKDITWHMDKPSACDKVGGEDEKSVSYKMIIPARLEINREGGKANLQYSIRATVNAQGRITAINLVRQ